MQRNLWDQVDEDLYVILDVPHTATPDEIVLAWRSTAKRVHPDLGGSADDFQRAEIAYEVLSNPLERQRYDRHLIVTHGTNTRGTNTRGTNAHGTGGHQPAASSSGPQFRTPPGWSPPNGPGWKEDRYRNPPKVIRPSWNLWILLVAALVIVGALLAAYFLAVVTPLLFIGLAIWIVGRSLNPKRPRDR